MGQFNMQRRKVKGWNRSCFPSFRPDFGVSTTILNTTTCRWCKLTLDLCEAILNMPFPWEDRGEEAIFLIFFYKLLGIIGKKRLGQDFWVMIWVYYYLLNGIRLDLGLDDAFWIWKCLTLLQATFKFRYLHTKHSLTSENRTC